MPTFRDRHYLLVYYHCLEAAVPVKLHATLSLRSNHKVAFASPPLDSRPSTIRVQLVALGGLIID